MEKIFSLIYLYYTLIEIFVNKLFNPISKVLSPYSETLSESVLQVSRIIINTIAISPIIIISVISSFYLLDGYITSPTNISLLLTVFVVTVFIFTSAFVITSIGSILKYNLGQKFFVSSILLISGISYYYVSGYEKYVILITTFYAFGAYITSIIKYENPYHHYYIYEELEPHNSIFRISGGFSIVIGFVGLIILFYDFESLQYSSYIIPIISGLISYLVTYLQIPHYKDIYKHVDLNTSSRFWILMPQLIVISSTGFYITDTIGITTYTVALLSPCIFGSVFKYYIDDQIEGNNLSEKFSSDSHFYTTFTDSNHSNGNFDAKPEQNIKIDCSINSNEDTASIKIESSAKIPEKFPIEYSNMPWMNMAEICESKRRLINNIDSLDEEDKKEFRSFYEDVLTKAAMEIFESDYENIDKYSDSLVEQINKQLHNIEQVNISDIRYLELKNNRSIKRDSFRYDDPER